MDQKNKIVKVLAIEDDKLIAVIYQHYLQDNGHVSYEFHVETTMDEGIKELSKNNYDIVLLDLNLPDSNAEETISQIPLISYAQPVIVMTAETDEDLVLKTLHLGSQDYLIKSELEKNSFLRSIGFAIERNALKAEIIRERERSDSLLKSILPTKIADELKADGITKARYYKDVSVMFIDFENFTKLSSDFSPRELVDELHICFCAFDEVMMRC
jgi:DNA-binding NtrC family response regulator